MLVVNEFRIVNRRKGELKHSCFHSCTKVMRQRCDAHIHVNCKYCFSKLYTKQFWAHKLYRSATCGQEPFKNIQYIHNATSLFKMYFYSYNDFNYGHVFTFMFFKLITHLRINTEAYENLELAQLQSKS